MGILLTVPRLRIVRALLAYQIPGQDCMLGTGYAYAAPNGTEDREALLQLFSTCLSGDAVLHGRLVDLLLQASEALAKCREAGTEKSKCLSLAGDIAQAISSLKLKVCGRLCFLCSSCNQGCLQAGDVRIEAGP